MKNIPPFYVGQKVVYITGKRMPKNSIHVITGVYQQPCGCYTVTINVKSPKEGFYTGNKCPDCGNFYHLQLVFVAWDPLSFRPLQELKAPMLTFEKIKEEEKEEILTLN